MSLYLVIGIGAGLSMDAFAVAIASSVALRHVSPRQVFRLAFHFGLFQAFMPMLGWAAGRLIAGYIQQWDHWVAFGLLTFVGVKAIREALHGAEGHERIRTDPTRGLSLVALSVATSIDAFAVGLTFAMLDVSIWYPCVLIGLITASLTTAGMLFGAKLGQRFGSRVEVLGGIVLILIGVSIVVRHLTA